MITTMKSRKHNTEKEKIIELQAMKIYANVKTVLSRRKKAHA